jgi:hypothetical protein
MWLSVPREHGIKPQLRADGKKGSQMCAISSKSVYRNSHWAEKEPRRARGYRRFRTGEPRTQGSVEVRKRKTADQRGSWSGKSP